MNTASFAVPLPAHKQLWRAVVALCCLATLESCDKEGTTVPQNAEHKETPVKNVTRPANTTLRSPLDGITLQLKDQGGDWEKRNEAIKIVKQIGEQRQAEAIPSLLDGMLIVQPFSINNALDYADTYPCSAALVQIGDPAVPQVQARILETGANIEQMVLLDTIRRIKGSDFVSQWLDSLPDSGVGSLSKQRLTELKHWVLSQAH